jgi:hypothetical protein
VKRSLVVSASLAAAVVVGIVATVAVLGGTPAPAAPAAVALSTATVVRTNLATTVLTGGMLGYAHARPVLNRLTGTYTQLPRIGKTIRPGQVLYRVDDEPVVLMTGRTPAWRPFAPGMTTGPDVTELQANLIVLGFASGLFSAPTGQFDLLTDYAVQRWQAAIGYPVTAQITLGDVVFAPTSIRVGALNVAPGQSASPGQAPYLVTTARRTVTVPVNPDLPAVAVGEHVSIVLPSNARTPGEVTAVGPAPVSPGSGSGAASAGASTVLTVTPDRPRVTGTGGGVPVQVFLTIQSVRHVLAVAVSALLALAGGGYGLEVVTPSGAHQLVGVTTGIFAGGLVQVSGARIVAGTKVVVAQ